MIISPYLYFQPYHWWSEYLITYLLVSVKCLFIRGGSEREKEKKTKHILSKYCTQIHNMEYAFKSLYVLFIELQIKNILGIKFDPN